MNNEEQPTINIGGNEYPVLNTVQRAACLERRADDIFDKIKTFCAVCGFETGEVIDLLVERQIARERAIENARREQKKEVPPLYDGE